VDDHRGQEGRAQQPKIHFLREIDPQNRHKRLLRTDGVVDDPLWKFQCQKKKRKQQAGDRKQNELVTFRMAPDEAEKSFFDIPPPSRAVDPAKWLLFTLPSGNAFLQMISDDCA
jgi:hypothetical protein